MTAVVEKVEKKPRKRAEAKVEERVVAVTVTGPKVGKEGEPIKGLTFGRFAEIVPKLGITTPLHTRRIWFVLRSQYDLLDFASFKIHPLREPGSSLTKAFQGMTKQARQTWAESVVANPPADMAQFAKINFKGDVDPNEVFRFLLSWANMPKAVADAPMCEGHFMGKGALAVIEAALKGDFTGAKELLAKHSGVKIPTKTVETVKVSASKKPAPKSKPAPKKAAPAKPKAPKLQKAAPVAAPAAPPAPATPSPS